MSGPFHYERQQLTRVLNAGPAKDETWFRLRVDGEESTKALSITREQLAALIEVVCDDKWKPVGEGQ